MDEKKELEPESKLGLDYLNINSPKPNALEDIQPQEPTVKIIVGTDGGDNQTQVSETHPPATVKRRFSLFTLPRRRKASSTQDGEDSAKALQGLESKQGQAGENDTGPETPAYSSHAKAMRALSMFLRKKVKVGAFMEVTDEKQPKSITEVSC